MPSADAQEKAKLTDEIEKINPGENAADAANLAAELVHLIFAVFEFSEQETPGGICRHI